MEMTWAAVPGYEGIYEVSTSGCVRSLDRTQSYSRIDRYSGRLISVTRRHSGKILSQGRTTGGYFSVCLGRENTFHVHVLVLLAFVGPRPAGKESLHGDGNPENNTLENLRWGTRSENLFDAVKHGSKPVGEKHRCAKLKASDVISIRSTPYRYGLFRRLARKYNINESSVRGVWNRKTWKHLETSRCS